MNAQPEPNITLLAGIFQNALAEWRDLLPKLATLEEPLRELAGTLRQCWRNKGKVLIAGNGGSAADSMHFAEELVVRYKLNRRGLAAIALCDPSVLTCAGNDFGYDQVFARQVEALGNPGDVLIVLSTSGNSRNLLLAIKTAKTIGLATVAFLGKDGGQTHGQCDLELLVPSNTTARIQETHKLLFHTLCEWVEVVISAS